MNAYDKANGELMDVIKQMRDEVDPKKVAAFDRECVIKLEALRKLRDGPGKGGVGSR